MMLGSNSKDKKTLRRVDMISEAEDVERVFMRQNMPPHLMKRARPLILRRTH